MLGPRQPIDGDPLGPQVPELTSSRDLEGEHVPVVGDEDAVFGHQRGHRKRPIGVCRDRSMPGDLAARGLDSGKAAAVVIVDVQQRPGQRHARRVDIGQLRSERGWQRPGLLQGWQRVRMHRCRQRFWRLLGTC